MSLWPISKPVSTTVKNDGTASIDVSGNFTNFWAMVLATMQQVQNINGTLTPVGNPNWYMLNGSDTVTFGQGASAEVGPRLFGPKATISIRVTNGVPGAQITGTLQGSYSDKPNELLWQPVYTALPSAIFAQVTPVQGDIIDTINNAAMSTVTDNAIPIPVGTVSIGFLVASGVGAPPTQVVVTGAQSGYGYFNGLLGLSMGIPQWFPFTPLDTTVNWKVVNNTGTATSVNLLASPVIQPYNNPNSPGFIPQANKLVPINATFTSGVANAQNLSGSWNASQAAWLMGGTLGSDAMMTGVHVTIGNPNVAFFNVGSFTLSTTPAPLNYHGDGAYFGAPGLWMYTDTNGVVRGFISLMVA